MRDYLVQHSTARFARLEAIQCVLRNIRDVGPRTASFFDDLRLAQVLGRVGYGVLDSELTEPASEPRSQDYMRAGTARLARSKAFTLIWENIFGGESHLWNDSVWMLYDRVYFPLMNMVSRVSAVAGPRPLSWSL